jgi:ethanolamine utilization protein EutN
MQRANVIGRATATLKHASLNGFRMLIVQPLTVDGGPDGDPQIAVDTLGSKLGDDVIISGDGGAASEIMNVKKTPVRWIVIGQPDEVGARSRELSEQRMR